MNGQEHGEEIIKAINKRTMIIRPVLTSISLLIFSTRFEVRGVNDDGHVANFVETEQLVRSGKTNN